MRTGAGGYANDLLLAMGLRADEDAACVAFDGEAPPLATRHRIVEASAAALAAQAAAVHALWRQAGGPAQAIRIDQRQATAALYPSRYQRQSGHPVPMMGGVELRHDFYETADGRWFYPIGSYPAFRNGVLDLLGCANNAEALGRAIRAWRAEDLEQAFADRRLVGTYVRSPGEWARHPQGVAMSTTPVIAVERIADGSAPLYARLAERPLAGVRVLDASHVIAGPVVGRTLAEHGADVLRVGAPHHPDPLLQIMDTGIGKRSAFVDLRRAEGVADMARLVEAADVFIDSWRAGCLARYGFDAEALARRRPGIVHVQVSGYGPTGPWAGRGGYEQVGQVVSGICHTEGDGGKPRLVPTYFLNDYLTGYLGAAGAVAALVRRAREGGSWRVHVSLTRTSMWVQGLGLQALPTASMDPFEIGPVLETRDSPFGRLEQLPPVARFSLTPARWDLPPVPLGASEPVWTALSETP